MFHRTGIEHDDRAKMRGCEQEDGVVAKTEKEKGRRRRKGSRGLLKWGCFGMLLI